MTGRILLLEDDEDLAVISSSALTNAGYSVEIARTVDDAVRRIEIQAPDVALIDIQLPERSGWDFIERVRAIGKWPNMRLALHTVHQTEPETKSEAARLHIDAVIGKGDPASLVAAVRLLSP